MKNAVTDRTKKRSWRDETENIKKLLLLNLPYFLLGLYATKLGQAYRLATGADLSGKLLHLMEGFVAAFQSPFPSFHPADLLVGLCCGAALRFAVYMKGKNAKKYRKTWSTAAPAGEPTRTLPPYVDPVFRNNVILTQTESLTMNSRPKDPRTARNKKCADYRRFRVRQDPLLAEAEPDADARFLRCHRP